MLADTDAIRAFGHAHAGRATDLTALAASVAAIPGSSTADALGSVAGEFVRALGDAVADVARAIAAAGDDAASAGDAAGATAGAYDDAERRNGQRF